MILGATDPPQSNNRSGPPSSEALDVLVPPQVASLTYSGRPFRSILVFLSLRLILGFGFVAVTVEKKFVLRKPRPSIAFEVLDIFGEGLAASFGDIARPNSVAPLLTTVAPVAYLQGSGLFLPSPCSSRSGEAGAFGVRRLAAAFRTDTPSRMNPLLVCLVGTAFRGRPPTQMLALN
jgi:hypothetical protein